MLSASRAGLCGMRSRAGVALTTRSCTPSTPAIPAPACPAVVPADGGHEPAAFGMMCATMRGRKRRPAAGPGTSWDREPGDAEGRSRLRGGVRQRVPQVGGYPAPDRVQAGPRLKALLEDHFEELCLVVVCESGITLAEAQARAC